MKRVKFLNICCLTIIIGVFLFKSVSFISSFKLVNEKLEWDNQTGKYLASVRDQNQFVGQDKQFLEQKQVVLQAGTYINEISDIALTSGNITIINLGTEPAEFAIDNNLYSLDMGKSINVQLLGTSSIKVNLGEIVILV